MSVALLRDNYFWSVYLTGRYRRDSCPEYLKPQSFAALKAGLVDNVRCVTATVTDCLRRDREGFSAFVLLDHMDWLEDAPRSWRRSGARSSRPRARARGPSSGAAARTPAFSPCPWRAVYSSSRSARGSSTPVTGSGPMAPSTSRASPPPPPEAVRFGTAELERFYRVPCPGLRLDAPLPALRPREAATALGVGPGDLVLDVGCGTGVNLPRLLEAGAEVIGIEPSPAMRERASARPAPGSRGAAGTRAPRPPPLRLARRLRGEGPRDPLLVLA